MENIYEYIFNRKLNEREEKNDVKCSPITMSRPHDEHEQRLRLSDPSNPPISQPLIFRDRLTLSYSSQATSEFCIDEPTRRVHSL